MQNLSVTAHDNSNSSVPNDRISCSHGNDGAGRSDENQINGNRVKKEPVEERLPKLGQGKDGGKGQGERDGKRQGVSEGQKRNVEGQGAQEEEQIQKDELHGLVGKGQMKDSKGQDKVKEGQNEVKEGQAEVSVMQEQLREIEGQVDNEKQIEILQTPQEGQIHDDGGNEKERRVQKDEDKEPYEVDLEGHEQGEKGQEQEKVVHVQDKEGQKHEMKGQEQHKEAHDQEMKGHEQDKEGHEQDKEGHEQDKEGQEEQEKHAQNEEEKSKTNMEVEDDDVAARSGLVDMEEKKLEKLDPVEEEREDLIRDGKKDGGGGVEGVEKSSQEEFLDDGVMVEGEVCQRVKCQGQAVDLHDEKNEEEAVKTTSGERDQKWTNRLKAMEAHISGSHQPHSSSFTTDDVALGDSEPRSSSTPSTSAMEDPTTCSIISGRETTIEIDKGRLALGVDVIGGVNTLLGVILVHEIYENGAAAKDGRLAIGDQIIEVNGELFHDITDELANEILRQTPPVVRLLVFREETPLREEEIYDLFNVDLLKKPGKGLGISIIGRHRDNGIFVSDVIKSGVADLDGQLMPGDQILVINGTDVRHVSQQFAAEMLKTLIGRVSLTVGRVKCLSRSTSRSSSSISEVDSDEEVAALASIPKKDHGKDKVKEKVAR